MPLFSVGGCCASTGTDAVVARATSSVTLAILMASPLRDLTACERGPNVDGRSGLLARCRDLRLATDRDPSGEEAGPVLPVRDAEDRDDRAARADQAHVVADEVAAGLGCVEHVEGAVGQPDLAARRVRVEAARL